MKTPFLLLLFSLFSLAVQCQNWAPINSTEQFNYSLGDADVITHSLKIDSVHVNGTDSIMFLNRVIAPCDTCIVEGIEGTFLWMMNGNFWLKDQPQFLTESVSINDQNDWNFGNETGFILKPNASLGEEWVFSSSLELNAAVSFIGFSDVLGTQDSVKTILLSTGDVIVLSKNHGIRSFPNIETGEGYALTGIEGRDIGELLPKFEDIYDFQVGDVIQYRDSHNSETTSNSNEEYENCNGIENFEVTSVDSYFDSVIVVYNRILNDTCYDVTIDQYTYEILEESITKKFYRSVYESYNPIPNSFSTSIYYKHFSCRYYRTSSGRLIQSFGGFRFIDETVDEFYLSQASALEEFGYESNGYLLGGELEVFSSVSLGGFTADNLAFSPCLGQISSKRTSSYYFNNGSDNGSGYLSRNQYVLAYSKDDEESEGELVPEDVLLGVYDLKNPNNNKILIYPNPANKRVILKSESPLVNEYEIRDIQGRVITTGLFRNSTSLDVSFMEKGMYAVSVSNERGKSSIERLIVE